MSASNLWQSLKHHGHFARVAQQVSKNKEGRIPFGIGAEFNNTIYNYPCVELAILCLQEKYGRNAGTQCCHVGGLVCVYMSARLHKRIFMRVICICQLSVCLHFHLAWQSVNQCMCRKSPTLLCVGCRHLSVNSSRFLSVFLCLSACQAASQKCLQKERSHLSELKGSPQRELRSPSISVGICDCQRSDKMPPGQCSVLRQAGILHRTDECCLKALSGTKAALLKLNTSA